MVSFCLLQVVVVSALMMFSDLFAFDLTCTLSVCWLKVSFVSKVTSNIFGCGSVGMRVLLIVRLSFMENSFGSGEKRVAEDLDGFSSSSFSLVQSNILFR